MTPLAFTPPPEAVAGFVDDVLRVAGHVLCNHTDYPWTRNKEALADSLMRHECPSFEVLDTVVAWTLFVLPWHATFRPLTADERAIHAAACRISDAIARAKHHV